METRLHQHVEKGREDGLYISCVASSANLWAVIMDAGTGFSSQVFELSPIFLNKVGISKTYYYQFLLVHCSKYLVRQLVISSGFMYLFPQDWIMEQWDKNYYITSLAGASNGSALVVMSKGK